MALNHCEYMDFHCCGGIEWPIQAGKTILLFAFYQIYYFHFPNTPLNHHPKIYHRTH